VFNTFVGQNGVVGIALGQLHSGWSSSETPLGGLSVRNTYPYLAKAGEFTQEVALMSVLPTDFVS
jgi:hypothetical protein